MKKATYLICAACVLYAGIGFSMPVTTAEAPQLNAKQKTALRLIVNCYNNPEDITLSDGRNLSKSGFIRLRRGKASKEEVEFAKALIAGEQIQFTTFTATGVEDSETRKDDDTVEPSDTRPRLDNDAQSTQPLAATADSSAIALNPSITSRVVLATDDGYAIPTAITTLSCLATTPDLEEIIVLYPHGKLSPNNIEAFKKLNKVTLLEVPEKYMDEAKSRSTKWNPLVQLRISYPELFQELRPELTGFTHMDSDTIAVRNLKDLLQDPIKHLKLNEKALKYLGDIPRIPFFLAARLRMLDDGKYINGGVVGWDLNAINKMSVSMSVLYALNDKNMNFYITTECLKLWEILRKSDERDEVIKTLHELAELTTESELEKCIQKLSFASEDLQASAQIFVQFIKSIITFSKGYKKNDDFNRQVITQTSRFVIDFLIKDSAPENEYPEIPRCRTKSWDNNTEEDVMGGYPWLELPPRWNFVMHNVAPQIFMGYEEGINFEYALPPELKTGILDEFQKIGVMHFDCCLKPWTKDFSERAKKFPELYKIIDVYYYYFSQLFEFDNLDEWKTFFASAHMECISNGHSDCWPEIKNAVDVQETLRNFKPSI